MGVLEAAQDNAALPGQPTVRPVKAVAMRSVQYFFHGLESGAQALLFVGYRRCNRPVDPVFLQPASVAGNTSSLEPW